MKKLLQTLLVAIVSYNIAFAAGFQINDHSSRSVAMGFSTVAYNPDASAIYFNPAFAAFQEGNLNLSAGLCYIMPSAKFTGPTTMNQNYTESLETWNFPIPHLFANWKTPVENLNLGLGVFVPFGLGTQWPENWYGRFLAKKTYLEAVEINPNLAYSFNLAGMPLAVSAGFGYVIGAVELERNLSTFTPEPVLNLKGKGHGTTFNFGLSALILDNLYFGASYRHNIEVEFEGDTKYENISGLEGLFQEAPGKAKLNFPNDLRAAFAYKLTPKFIIEAGINYVGWSSYDTLKIEFEKGPGNPSKPYTSAAERLYKNIITYRLGAEYLMDKTALRCGVYYEPMPVEAKHVEPLLPESNRIGTSVGFGYQLFDNINLDFGYLFIIGSQTEVVGNPNLFDGYYNSWANIVSLTLSYTIK